MFDSRGAVLWRLLNETAVGDLSDVAKAWALKRSGELISRIEGLRAELIAALAGPKPSDPAEDWAAHDVAVAAKCSLPAAQRKIAYARALDGRLAATREALLAGRITERQATLLAEETAHLSDEDAAEGPGADAEVLPPPRLPEVRRLPTPLDRRGAPVTAGVRRPTQGRGHTPSPGAPLLSTRTGSMPRGRTRTARDNHRTEPRSHWSPPRGHPRPAERSICDAACEEQRSRRPSSRARLGHHSRCRRPVTARRTTHLDQEPA